MKTAFIFLPDSLSLDEIGMLEGFAENYDDNITFYVTNRFLVAHSTRNIGYCSEKTPDLSNTANTPNNSEWIHVNLSDGTITILNKREEYKIICVRYDYRRFKQSEITTYDYGVHFEVLAGAIKTERSNKINKQIQKIFFTVLTFIYFIFNSLSKVCDKVSKVCQYSAIAQHLGNSVKSLEWAFWHIQLERKVSLRTGNVLVAKFLDFVLGIVIIHYSLKYENQIVMFVENSTESIVQGLKQLLIFLMGSPVGLKLNYALNKTLGSFFMYHLSLWRAFLVSMRPFLHYIFHLLIIPGSLGFSFQIALIEDFIAFSTLHVYCIYVYAARLYRIQVIGLSSLWPLFIGRKYNPLRNRVDSHQYSHHQLFVGTLGFTILLFLWPTTFLYYSIFTMLRIGLILLGKVLTYIRIVLQHLPVYIAVMWLLNSPSLAGTIRMKIGPQKSETSLTLYATLLRLSLKRSVLVTLPATLPKLPLLQWSTWIKNSFNGVLL